MVVFLNKMSSFQYHRVSDFTSFNLKMNHSNSNFKTKHPIPLVGMSHVLLLLEGSKADWHFWFHKVNLSHFKTDTSVIFISYAVALKDT